MIPQYTAEDQMMCGMRQREEELERLALEQSILDRPRMDQEIGETHSNALGMAARTSSTLEGGAWNLAAQMSQLESGN